MWSGIALCGGASSLAQRWLRFLLVLILGYSGANPAVAGVIVSGEQKQYLPGTDVWVEFFVDLTDADDGGSLLISNFRVRVELTGSNAGIDATVMAVDETVDHPQAGSLVFETVESPTRAFGSTFNFGPAFTVNDGDGLMRVNLNFGFTAMDTYHLNILTGMNDTALFDSGGIPVAFTTQDAQIAQIGQAIPEPSSLLLMLAAAGIGGAMCLRRSRSRQASQPRA